MSPRTSNADASATRQAQIVEATVRTIAEVGLAQTTFARIAAAGGLSSTRLISYHFDGKAALLRAVVAHVYRSIDAFLAERSAEDPASRPIAAGGPPQGDPPHAVDELRAYVVGVAAYVDAHREQMRALQAIFAGSHDAAYDPAALQADPRAGAMRHLQGVVRRGQAAGEIDDVDALVVAAMIQRPLEALPQLLVASPSVDPAAFAIGLADAVERVVRVRSGASA